jgi:hypothetical protein
LSIRFLGIRAYPFRQTRRVFFLQRTPAGFCAAAGEKDTGTNIRARMPVLASVEMTL